MELIGEDAATFVFMTPILWAFQWIRCSQTFLLKGFVKGLCTIQTKFRQHAWSLGVRAQVSPEDISLVELGEGERAASTSKGGAGTTSSRRAARESLIREGDSDSDERPSGKVRPSVKESSGAKAESEEEKPSGKEPTTVGKTKTTVKGKKTSRGGAPKSSQRQSVRESLRREAESDEKPSVKESTGAKAESEEEKQSVKVRASGKESTTEGKAEINLNEAATTVKGKKTSRGGAPKSSQRQAARDSLRREAESDEKPSGKEWSGANAESEEEKPSGKVKASGKESTSDGKSTTNWNEARAAAGKRRAAAQIRNSSIGIGNLEPALGSRHLKPIRPKRPRIKRVIPIQSKTCHRAADVQDSPEYELSLCQPPIPTSPHQHGSLPTNVICSLPTNVMPDPASLSSAPGVQNSDTTYLSVQSLPPGHPLYFSRSEHPSPTMLESPNSQTRRQLSSSPMPQFSLNSISPSYF